MPGIDGVQVSVEDVPGNQNQVRVFAVEQVAPPSQLRFAVVVPHVEVAGQNQRERFFEQFICLDINYFSVFMLIVEVAVGQQDGDDADNGAAPCGRVFQEAGRYQSDRPSQPQRREKQQGIHKENHPRSADEIGRRPQPERRLAVAEDIADEKEQEAAQV